jgi:hypothetical protein
VRFYSFLNTGTGQQEEHLSISMALRTTSGPVLSYDPEGDQSYCAYENATRYDVCQSSSFRSLWAHYGHVGSCNPKTMIMPKNYQKRHFIGQLIALCRKSLLFIL